MNIANTFVNLYVSHEIKNNILLHMYSKFRNFQNGNVLHVFLVKNKHIARDLGKK